MTFTEQELRDAVDAAVRRAIKAASAREAMAAAMALGFAGGSAERIAKRLGQPAVARAIQIEVGEIRPSDVVRKVGPPLDRALYVDEAVREAIAKAGST